LAARLTPSATAVRCYCPPRTPFAAGSYVVSVHRPTTARRPSGRRQRDGLRRNAARNKLIITID